MVQDHRYPSVIMQHLLTTLFFGMVPVPRSTQMTAHTKMLVKIRKPPMSIVQPISVSPMLSGGDGGAVESASLVASAVKLPLVTFTEATVLFASEVFPSLAFVARRRMNIASTWIESAPTSSMSSLQAQTGH